MQSAECENEGDRDGEGRMDFTYLGNFVPPSSPRYIGVSRPLPQAHLQKTALLAVFARALSREGPLLKGEENWELGQF